jgi:hypothetical protein
VIRSPKDLREDRTGFCRGISSIFGTTGTSIFGGGGGAGGGGLNGDDPGGIMTWAKAKLPAATAGTITPINRRIWSSFRVMTDMS